MADERTRCWNRALAIAYVVAMGAMLVASDLSANAKIGIVVMAALAGPLYVWSHAKRKRR